MRQVLLAGWFAGEKTEMWEKSFLQLIHFVEPVQVLHEGLTAKVENESPHGCGGSSRKDTHAPGKMPQATH